MNIIISGNVILPVATFPGYDFADDTNTRVGCSGRELYYFGNNYGQLLDTVFIMDPFISHYHENFLAVIYDFEYKSLNTCHVSYLITSCITRFIFNKHFLFNWSICLKCKLCFQIELLQISYHYFRWKDKASNT